MTVKEKQARILSLFERLTSLDHHPIDKSEVDPRLHNLGHLPRGTLFSCFHEDHLAEATHLYEILNAAKDFDDFMTLAKQAKDLVNEGLFTYATSVSISHRKDCHGVRIPPIQEIFPDRFVPAETIVHARKEAINHPDKDIEVEIEDTGNIFDPEYKLSYFREDIGVNAHHWHWHIIYPATWDDQQENAEHKDRKGELFFYMHQQMCARYDCERLCNGMHRMTPFHNFEEPLEGYSPHLTTLVSGLHYASRPDGFSLQDLDEVDVIHMIRWRERILEAIHLGYVIDREGKHIKLDEEHGLDILGALMESSVDSVNDEYYGSLHNWGHVMMAQIHDPDNRFQENPGVMSDTSTSLRDPIFYRYHRFIDNLFQEYKATLHSYTKEDLDFAGVDVKSIAVNSKVSNVLTTLLKEAELELTHGIDLDTTHSVKVKYHHIDHEPFTYTIIVENTTGGAKQATVRIFLAPKYDELGNHLEPDEQRHLYIELDKFHIELAAGKNVINHDHRDSSVTVSKVPTFKELEEGHGVGEDSSEFCSCGWPEHMLVPKGNHKGMEFDLFVMLSDWEHDNVNGGSDKATCSDAVSYCGAKDHKYPDKRAMGFPFDRVIEAKDIHEFMTHNMAVADIKIKFQG